MANYKHDAGVSGTVTVPSGYRVKRWSAIGGGSDGTVTITPFHGTEQPAIVLPAGRSIRDELTTNATDLDGVELPAGSTLVFAGSISYWVVYA